MKLLCWQKSIHGS
uniref:Early nodulin-40 n=2 Tax=IRL clade TaxID=2233839 RepID=NO40_VICSA|nr:RecName: Full=Early nodulin-40 [Vicia sativa]AAM83035.1 early nodulin enod40-1 [Trifolium repens]AAM83036.1 early nodulin enod40-2 [Trifolium repens]CAB37926.1 early nodulin 40 [Vicia sativa subsp. nigra]